MCNIIPKHIYNYKFWGQREDSSSQEQTVKGRVKSKFPVIQRY